MLNGKKVFISGGTGYIGKALCKKCCEYGADVYFSYNKHDDEAQEILRQYPGTTAVKLNLRDYKSITTVISALYEKIDAFDILINNAGTSQVMPFSMIEEDDVDLLLDVNVKGTLFVTKAVVKRMIRGKKGAIVTIGSIAGHRIFDVPVHYALSKSALSGMMYALTNELRHFNIRINTVVPGMLEDGVARGIPDELREDYLNHCAAGRPGTADDVAEVVCFLASDKAGYVNGQHIFVDGGI